MLIPKVKIYDPKKIDEKDRTVIARYAAVQRKDPYNCFSQDIWLNEYNLSLNSQVKIGNLWEYIYHDVDTGGWVSVRENIGSVILIRLNNKEKCCYFEYLGTPVEKLDKFTVLKLAKALEIINKEKAFAKIFGKKFASQIAERHQKVIGLFTNGVNSEEDIKNVLTEKEYVAACKFAKKLVVEKEEYNKVGICHY